MSVFPFPDIVPNESSVSLVSNTATNVSPHTGKIQSVDRQGERLKLRMTFNSLKDDDRSRLQAFIARLNGQQHRFTVYDHSYTARGVLSVSEMLDVAFNATNWESNDTNRGTITDVDDGIRFRVGSDSSVNPVITTVSAADGISAPTAGKSYSVSLSSFDSRAASDGGAKPPVRVGFREADAGTQFDDNSGSTTEAQRLVAQATAPSATTLFPRATMNVAGAGDYAGTVDIRDLSVSRAFLVDNGFNALLRSEEFDNASWTKTRTTITSNPSPGANAPDGSDTADELVEDSTASQTHFVSQTYTRPSVAEYWTASVYIKSNTSQRIRLFIDNGSGSADSASQFFDATTGAETGTAAVVGSATNAYSSMHDVGDGWYRCRLSVRLPADTDVRLIINLCDGASNTVTFNGDGTSGLYIWGAQLQRGGQLGRYTPTTDTVITGTDQTGKQIWVKGGDADTNGARKQGDQVEIDGHLAILTADLDFDASGVGLLEFTPRKPTAPADEAPVILYRPHGKWILTKAESGWSNRPGVFSDFTIEAIQDI